MGEVASIARVIAEAAVRLRIDGRGLALEIRQTVRRALQEAEATQVSLSSPTTRMANDADRDANRMGRSLRSITSGLLDVGRAALTAALNGGRLLLIGTAAAGALAGVVGLTLGLAQLGQAALQAAGVIGLLPAALAALKASTAAIKLALSGMGEAMSAIASGDAAAFEEAVKNLSPAARAFAREVKALKPAFDQVRLKVQEALFLDLAEVVQPLGDTYLPVMSAAFQGVARNAGIAAKDTANFLLQGEQLQKVREFSANLQTAFGNLAGALRPAVSAILDLVSTGSSFLPELTESLNQWATGFAARIREAARSGELEAFFQRSIDTLKTLGTIVGNVFGSIRNIFKAAGADGQGFLDRLKEITQRFQDFTGSARGQAAFGGFFESIQRVLDALGPAFMELIVIIGRDFLPILADIAEAIGPVLKPLFETFGRLLQAIRPLILAFAKAFSTALEGLIPFFDALADAINEHMPILGPLIEDIGVAFADFFEAMAPLAPLFVQLFEAILPIIPPLIQMATELLPKFFPLIDQIIIVIAEWVDLMVVLLPIMTDVAGAILDIVLPVLEGLVFVIGRIVDGFGIMITGVRDGTAQISEIFQIGWQQVVGFFTEGSAAADAALGGGVDSMLGRVQDWGAGVIRWAQDTMTSFANWVRDGVNSANRWFNGLISDIGSAFADAGSWLINAGRDIINGLLNGLRRAAGSVISFFTDMISRALQSVYDALGMSSPSKVFREIGQQIGAGLMLGIQDGTGDVVDAAVRMAQAVTDATAIAPQVTLGSPTSVDLAAARQLGQEAPVIQQTNIMRPGTDVQQFANTVLQRGYGGVLASGALLSVRRNPVQAGVDDQWVTL